MPTIKERLAADFKEALKSRDEVRKNTVSFARAAIKQFEVDNRTDLDDAGVLSILAKQVKMRKDALADFERAGRTDLLDSYNKEIAILQEYLPEQLSPEKVLELVKEAAEAAGIEAGSGKASIGKLMGAVMPKVKGLADGGVVKQMVDKYLS